MIVHGFESLTAISNGSAYTSRSVSSSKMLLTVWRSVSASFATKCLRHAPTPCCCMPRTKAAASFPDRTESSEYASKWRPPKGER